MPTKRKPEKKRKRTHLRSPQTSSCGSWPYTTWYRSQAPICECKVIEAQIRIRTRAPVHPWPYRYRTRAHTYTYTQPITHTRRCFTTLSRLPTGTTRIPTLCFQKRPSRDSSGFIDILARTFVFFYLVATVTLLFLEPRVIQHTYARAPPPKIFSCGNKRCIYVA